MILGVFAHPDDELFAAALLAQYARSNAVVEIVVATCGERGHSSIESNVPLAELRTAELRESCNALGIGPPQLLHLPDGELDACEAELAHRLEAIIDQHQPTTIVTTGPDGVYGHLDHIAVTSAVRSVASCEVLHTAFPCGFFDPVRRSLRKLGSVPLADSISLGVDQRDVDRIVLVEPVRDEKQRAIASHRSQLRGGELLRPGLTEHLLAVEWYSRRV